MRDFTVTPIEKQRYDGHVDFPTQYKLALQARQSSKEQRLHNQESYESQTTVLLEHALDMGWHGMEVDIIPFLENKSKNGKIIDASGTKRIDERPTMQDLWYHIEHDIVKAVMTRGVDRLFRHIDMIEPAMFAKLCEQHRCIIITVREVRHRTKIEVYNFHENPEDTGAFLAEAQDAADYISNQIDWMNRCKMNKGLRGEYDGRTVPVGFILDTNRAHYIVYEPHARVVRWIFGRYRELGGNFAALKQEIKQKIAEQGYVFPFFPDDMRHQRVNLDSNGEGYTISARGLKMLLTNVAYIGIWQVYETIDKDTDHPQRVLRASIENNHPAIVDSVDFWYAYDRLTDTEQPRSRYTKVGTTSCDALLEGIVTSEGMEVYVYQKAQEPDRAVYVIANNEVLYGNRVHGSLYVRDLDRIFSQYLLAKLEAGKRLRDQFAGSELLDDLEGMENATALRLIELTKAQEVSTAGIDAQIAGYSEEAESLDKALHFGAAKLSPKKIEEYSERLTKLETTIAQLVFKKDRAAKTQAELAEFNEKLVSVPAAWKDLGIENQRRFVSLVTVRMTLTKPAPHWLLLKIVWLWPGAYSTCYIWQRQGAGESWTEEENAILRRLYPETDRAIILAALPSRSWTAISNRAHDLQLGRTYQSNSSKLHRLVSVNDAAFMAQAGIQLDPQNPYQQVWWQDVIEDDTEWEDAIENEETSFRTMNMDSKNEQKRLLLLMSPATYRAGAFLNAAKSLNLEIVVGIDLPETLSEYWHVPLGLDFMDHAASLRTIVEFAQEHPIHAIISVDDSATELAARASAALGLAHNSPQAAEAARDKLLMRTLMSAGGAPCPVFRPFGLSSDPARIAGQVTYPCVLKPLRLSGSRGVIRADDPAGFVAAFNRLKRLLISEGNSEYETSILVEDFIPGFEVALEGMLTHGALKVLALFDKPDPLDGPFFEETIYTTPSRLPASVQDDIARCVATAAASLGLQEGPVHAELRVNEQGPWMLEMAGRSIGGLCSTILEFGSGMCLEELILRHAIGEEITAIERDGHAAGVMMIPIPAAGILKSVHGVEEALQVPLITGIEITAKLNYALVPLPEGASYLGFIFARGNTPAEVEEAIRKAHKLLKFDVRREIPVLKAV